MISIAKSVPSGSGDSIVIGSAHYQHNAKLFESQSRVAKTLTLDGGVVITTDGYVEVDRNLSFNIKNLTKAQAAVLRGIYTSQVRVVVAIPGAVYDCVISFYNDVGKEIRMTAMIESKLTA